jgi:cytochrome b involved in lipid metabolism
MTEVKLISQKELEQHTEETDCWLAIHGKIYDVSSYLVDHPGGLDVMMEYAGACALPYC